MACRLVRKQTRPSGFEAEILRKFGAYRPSQHPNTSPKCGEDTCCLPQSSDLGVFLCSECILRFLVEWRVTQGGATPCPRFDNMGTQVFRNCRALD